MHFSIFKLFSELFWKNPQFQLRLIDKDVTSRSDKCTLIISLMEKEQDNKSKIAVGFDVYTVLLEFYVFM